MAAQKRKKIFFQKIFFAFLNAYYLKTDQIKSLNSLVSFRPYGRLLKNKKAEVPRELFLPENDFQTSSTKIFPINIQILVAWKPTEDTKVRLEFFSTCPSTYELIMI